MIARFRSWPSIEEGFRGRNAFLLANPRYRARGVFSAPTPAEQARAFQAAGYATDPQYAATLIGMLNTYAAFLA